MKLSCITKSAITLYKLPCKSYPFMYMPHVKNNYKYMYLKMSAKYLHQNLEFTTVDNQAHWSSAWFSSETN
jgi:hypothetical protein